ncbi:MAG: YbaB/EbfC family nucleoid-associated protein [Oscillospiraceae bacterium]
MKARLPAGYGGGPQNQKDLVRQAQKMQEQMAQKQAELEEQEYTATSGGGMVTAIVNGGKQLHALTINPEIVDPEDVEMLQDIIMAAVNEGFRMADDATSQEMGKLAGGLNLSGISGLF